MIPAATDGRLLSLESPVPSKAHTQHFRLVFSTSTPRDLFDSLACLGGWA